MKMRLGGKGKPNQVGFRSMVRTFSFYSVNGKPLESDQKHEVFRLRYY